MAQLSLILMGQFQVRLADQLLTTFESDKVRALLCYLAVEPSGIPHSRDTLAALLWPGYGDESARTNLRQTLYHLRKLLGDDRQEAADAAPFLLATRQTIALNPAASCQVDVRQLDALLAATASHDHRTLADCAACQQRLRQAVDLYQGEFLTGFTIADSAPFEEWRRMVQEQLHGQVLAALTQLADAAEVLAAFPAAQHYAERQLQLEPWREAAHRQIMRVLTQSGQRAAALAQYQRCCQILRTELNVEPDSETTALFEQIRTGKLDRVTSDKMGLRQAQPPVTELVEVTQSSPHPVASPPLHNLPTPLTPFIGRTSELAKLLLQLQQPDCRLLTLVGPGGMGKTRLALEVARQRLGSYADGVFLVSLTPLTADGVAPTIATTLGLTLSSGDPQAALQQLLASKQLLLVLDNFEHLLGAAGLVADLLQSAPRIQILVTSRIRLNLQGEHFVLVQPMRFGGASTMAETVHTDAVRLFVQSAQRNHPDFLLDHNNLPAVLRICQLVEGMPLGLEMAAGWVELLSLAEIAAEIERSVDFLTAEWSNAPERQRSMRAVFEWSWRLLSDAEQQTFRQLALFRGGFTREAAEQVAGASLRVLAALVHKSLVRRVEQDAGQGSVRYDIHELVRQFAAEALADLPSVQQQIEVLYSNYYLDFIAARQQRLQTNDPRRAAAELQVEIDNIRQAWQLAAHHRWLSLLAKSVVALREFYVFSGLPSEGSALLAEAIATLRQPAASAMVSTEQPQQQRLLSTLLGFHSSFLIGFGEHMAAQAEAEVASHLGQLYGSITGETVGALVLGQVQRRLGNTRAAERQLLQTIALAQHHRDQPLYRNVLADVERRANNWLCSIALTQDDFLAAKRYAQAGLAICQSTSCVTGEIVCLTDLSDVARILGDYTAAQQEGERSLQLARQVGFRWGEASGLWQMGRALRLSGEYAQAAAILAEAGQYFRTMGQYLTESEILTDLGRLHLNLGDFTAAEHCLTMADTILQSLHYPAWETYWWLLTQALLAHATGQPQTALHHARRGYQMAQELYGQTQQADALIVCGVVMEENAAVTETIAVYQQALEQYSVLGLHHIAAEPRAGLARLALQQGDHATALTHAETLLQTMDELPQVGVDEPFGIYLSCYHVLAANGDPRAVDVLRKGQALLQQYADRLPDPQMQRAFLDAVPIHRALYSALNENRSSC